MPLTPQDMTPEQVADLVARAKANESAAQRRARQNLVPYSRRHDGAGAKAARYAREHGVSLTIAGERYGISRQAAREVWCRMFPGEPTPRSPRRRGAR